MSMFAPPSGICWSCKRDIYKDYTLSRSNQNERLFGKEKEFRMVEYVSKGKNRGDYITGCPHCNRSYVD